MISAPPMGVRHTRGPWVVASIVTIYQAAALGMLFAFAVALDQWEGLSVYWQFHLIFVVWGPILHRDKAVAFRAFRRLRARPLRSVADRDLPN